MATVGEPNVPAQVCAACFEKLTRLVSSGVQLRAEAKAREHNRNMLWKNRVNLIKQARQYMDAKAYSQAAVSYEKYLKVLELVFNLKSGEITPDIFNKSNRSKELTVVTSVYWDLMRIYDTSPRYGERMRKAAYKLGMFIPYSSIFPEILKKAESFQKSAKNPQVVREFLKTSKKSQLPCFVATAAFSSSTADEVIQLKLFRDHVLRKSRLGRLFIRKYYRLGRRLAPLVREGSMLKPLIRFLLKSLSALIAFGMRNL